MRTICKNCVAVGGICKGDDENCAEVMRYDEGYEAAVAKAARWIYNNPAMLGDSLRGHVEKFMHAMTNEDDT